MGRWLLFDKLAPLQNKVTIFEFGTGYRIVLSKNVNLKNTLRYILSLKLSSTYGNFICNCFIRNRYFHEYSLRRCIHLGVDFSFDKLATLQNKVSIPVCLFFLLNLILNLLTFLISGWQRWKFLYISIFRSKKFHQFKNLESQGR